MGEHNRSWDGFAAPWAEVQGEVMVATPPERSAAVELREWWGPVYLLYAHDLERYAARLLRRYGVHDVGGHEPTDLVQGYFAQMMEKDGLRKMTEIRDLSAFVFASFWRFARGKYRESNAGRRCPKATIVSLDQAPPPCVDPSCAEGDESVQHAIDLALDRLQARLPRYALVIVDMIDEDDGGRTGPELLSRLGIEKRNLASLKYRARRRFARLLLAALGYRARDPSEILAIQQRFFPWSLGD